MMDNDDPLPFLIRRWIHGESAAPAMQLLLQLGRHDEAATMARVAIRDPVDAEDEQEPRQGWSIAGVRDSPHFAAKRGQNVNHS